MKNVSDSEKSILIQYKKCNVKMLIYLLLCLCLQTTITYTMPLQMQLLQPMLQQQQSSLQQQLLALQQFQVLQKLKALRSPTGLNLPKPLLILLPSTQKIVENEEIKNLDKSNIRDFDSKPNQGIEDEDAESIVIDAEMNAVKRELPRAVLLVPNDGRFSIGDFISSIPFLPFEINVPDSISWIYNGISGIISGIGQRITYKPQTLEALESMEQNGVNLRLNQLHTRKVMPILVMPLVYP